VHATVWAVFQTISDGVDLGMNVVQAVNAPRVHHQRLPDQTYHEPGGPTEDVAAGLTSMGHGLVERGEMSGDVQAILVMPHGWPAGASDPRRGGTAIGY
jgi:gamma-glutamyltranspeptidase